jgi:DNA-binding CsgD family transcriptional regulator
MKTVSDALDLVYEAAAANERSWPVALDALARGLGAYGCAVVPRDPDRMEYGAPASRTIADVFAAFLAGGWHRKDLRGDRAWPRFDRGDPILVDEDLVTPEERANHPYFQEFFKAYDLPWAGCLGLRTTGSLWCIGLLRPGRDGPFRREELAMHLEVGVHVARALTLAGTMRRALEQRSFEIVDAMGLAAIMLDTSGKTTNVTARAQAIIADGDLRYRHGVLSAIDPANDRLLQVLVRRASGAATPAAQTGDDTVVLDRRGRRPLTVQAIKLPAAMRDVFTRDSAVLILNDMARDAPVPPDLLRKAFGLTPTEAEVAARVAGGSDPRSIADGLGISHETVRVHLKKVFSKTETARQADLAILVNRFTPRIH